MDNNEVAKSLLLNAEKKIAKERQAMFDHITSITKQKDVNITSCESAWEGEAVDSMSGTLYDFEYLHLQELWTQYGIRGQGANVYVIDSGIDDSHPGFIGHDIRKKSFLKENDSPKDGNGHGTWVCGKISAQGTGIAPKCSLTSFRALDDNGFGTADYSTAALKWILDNEPEANIVNMSLGSPLASPQQEKIINKLAEQGVLVVAAAGNYNSEAPFYPGDYASVLTVAATNKQEVKADFSNYGGDIDIAAPGVACYGPFLNGAFRKLSGTSMATPIVVGVLTLGISYLKNVKNISDRPFIYKTITQALYNTAKDIGQTGKDKYYGFGGINALVFMQKLSEL